ncbi:MAG: tyrosine-type recombinase/integrase, partial [Syntrophorhabdales bacterium]
LIRRTWSDYTVRETTKAKTKEWIPLSGRAVEIAEDNCRGKHPEAWLFINPNSGSTFRPKRLGAIWNEYSGIDVTLYEATRHSFCTQLVEDGTPLPVIRKLARHADIRTTQKYVHVTDDVARAAVERRGKGKLLYLESEKKAKRGTPDEK